ncbi:hypothetical protein LC162_24815, partial [Escherichia coli]
MADEKTNNIASTETQQTEAARQTTSEEPTSPTEPVSPKSFNPETNSPEALRTDSPGAQPVP